MISENLWQVFKDTGEPICWLLSRMAEPENKKEKDAGERRTPDADPGPPRSSM